MNITTADRGILSLTEAREKRGMTIEEASGKLNIGVEDLVTYEKKPSEMEIELAIKIGKLYELPLQMMDFAY
ncbi:helix-turn-helix domain-containing protein [Paenibacillus vandeheii]